MFLESAFAQSRAIKSMEGDQFDSLGFMQMDTKTIYYTDKILAFGNWSQQAPLERKALVLYPGYDEPTVTLVKNGVRKQQVESLMVFVSRFKLVLNKAPGQIQLKNLINLDTIGRFDNEIQHVQIQQNQLMSAVAGKGQIANFQWCNKTGNNIFRPAREIELSYTNPKNRNWCADSARSICVESCYLFNKYWYEGVKVVNLALEEAEKKDYGIALQSEIRYFSNEQELGLSVPVAQLTGLNTAVRGGLEQNMFYFDQVLEFGKIVAVLQDQPGDPGKTAATVFFVVGIKRRTYNQFGEVKKVLLGQSKLFNTDTGITAGLPVFTQNMVKQIANILEN
jgi:hypothetical protein